MSYDDDDTSTYYIRIKPFLFKDYTYMAILGKHLERYNFNMDKLLIKTIDDSTNLDESYYFCNSNPPKALMVWSPKSLV